MPTAMAREALEAPDAVARLLDREAAAIDALGRRLAALAPPVVVTSARGSSDHAAMYLKYLLELATGTPVASIGPSIASVYGVRPRLAGGVLVTLTQSGRSPDLVMFQSACRDAGALTIALVNDAESPVAAGADVVIPLHAGAETSVAATKSFIATISAAAALVAAWTNDQARRTALAGLPGVLAQALAAPLDLSAFAAPSAYVLGRGPALAMAAEAALKLKEVAARHAEAFSLAEVMHGPLRLAGPGFPVLAFLPQDQAAEANAAAIARLRETGAIIRPATAPATGDPGLDPIAMIAAFYPGVEHLSRSLGFDPDHPAHLRKVTQTR